MARNWMSVNAPGDELSANSPPPSDNATDNATDGSQSSSSEDTADDIPPPRARPWRWICHGCGQRHRVAVTARCLNCGHRFCGGFSEDRVISKAKRHARCKSFFDRTAWAKYIQKKKDTLSSNLEKLKKWKELGCGTRCKYPGWCYEQREIKRAKKSGKFPPLSKFYRHPYSYEERHKFPYRKHEFPPVVKHGTPPRPGKVFDGKAVPRILVSEA